MSDPTWPHVFVLMMHLTHGDKSANPVDLPIGVYESQQQCLAAAGFFAQQDQDKGVSGESFQCANVGFYPIEKK